MISIIIPVYNQAEKLQQTLISINKQSYRNLEVIIVNDGSTDNPEKTFTDFLATNQSDLSFSFFNQVNLGAPAARNHGFRESKGEYLFFCDADAILEEQALETLLKALENNPNISYAYPSFKWGRKLFKGQIFDAEKLKKQPYIHTMALIRRADFPVTGWDESIKKFQDWDLWLTMLENNKIGFFVDQVLFTVTPGGTISSWLPGFAYKIFPFLPAVKKYQTAMAVIYNKHQLSK
jgi:glycosyltransferase involved in cell wall biosynthesis